jgi:hypothetical protein
MNEMVRQGGVQGIAGDICALFRANRVAFFSLFLLYAIGIFALLRSNTLYINDTARVFHDGLFFSVVGRYLAEWLGSLLFVSYSDLSPLTQLGGVACIAAAGIFFCAALFRRKVRMGQVFCCLPLALSPYFLQNISYKYDSLFMSLAVLCVAAAFYVLVRHGSGWQAQMVACVLFFCSLGLYQGMCNLYFFALAFWMIRDLLEGKGWWAMLWRCLRTLPALAVALGVYKLSLRFVELNSYSREHGLMLPLQSMALGVWNNMQDSLAYIYFDWNSNSYGYIMALAVLCMLLAYAAKAGRLALPLGQRIVRFLAAAALFGLSCCAVLGLTLLLKNIVLQPRVYVGVGFIMSMILLYTLRYSRALCCLCRMCSVGVIAIALSYCMGFASLYGNALSWQNDYEDIIYAHLLPEVKSYCQQFNTNRICFIGSMPRSPLLPSVEAKYPILNKLVKVSMEGASWHTPRALEANGVSRQLHRAFKENIDLTSVRLLSSTPYYSIGVNNDSILVLNFTKDDS